MDIHMIGIDHNTASVKIREQFSFTAAQAGRAMEFIKKQPGVRGCVLLSTCNRVELYVSMAGVSDMANQAGQGGLGDRQSICRDAEPDRDQMLLGLLWEIKQLPGQMEGFRQYFTYRQADQAVGHLFYLASGLKSQIFGEDQILSQVKEAVQKSRELYCTDTLLEVLFRQAVTAGKEVKAKIPAAHADASAAHSAVAGLRRQGYVLEGKRCLVIGNGQMGKAAAMALQEEGAEVTVTVRQYRSGIVEIPKGCSRIHYGERYSVIPQCDFVVSATVSPNLTVRTEELSKARGCGCRPQVYVDLAVPRDIEEGVASLAGATLYDIDSFQSGRSLEELGCQRKEAEKILMRRIDEFWDWYECRGIVPRIQKAARLAAEDICWRMGRGIAKLPKEEQGPIGEAVMESSQKAVAKMLFALRDGLPREELYRCMDVLEGIWDL